MSCDVCKEVDVRRLARENAGGFACRVWQPSRTRYSLFRSGSGAVGEGRNGFEKLLSEVAGPVDPSTVSQFPTADCLTPEDVHGIEYPASGKAIESLAPEKQEHLASCPWCQRMVSPSQPNGEEFADALAKARAALRQREGKLGELKDNSFVRASGQKPSPISAQSI